MVTSLRESYSIFRGQADTGIGEGPGRAVARGEQYLDADTKLVDNHLLTSLRPWLSLDADPGDRRQLGEALEVWSCVEEGGFLVVARLVPAGIYRRRAAYFAHGRAWPSECVGNGFDPAAHLGRCEAFDPPWRDVPPGERPHVSVPEVSPVRPEQVLSREKDAEMVLACLLEGRSQGTPVCLLAPVRDFRAGGELHALASIARAALPEDLRRGCRVRVYTRSPELFLRTLGADLLVVPEDLAAQAIAASRGGRVLDPSAGMLSGEEPGEDAREYARRVLGRFGKFPQGLLAFSSRYAALRSTRGVPVGSDLSMVTPTYNIAVALDEGDEQLGDLFERYMKAAAKGPTGQDIPWERLLAPDEWQRFPRQLLISEVLRDPTVMSRGERRLQVAVEKALGCLKAVVDRYLDDEWSPERVARLSALLELDPPLVSPGALAARTRRFPLAAIQRSERPDILLAAELTAGVIGDRASDAGGLADMATGSGCRGVLLEATAKGALDGEWAVRWIERASKEKLRTTVTEALFGQELQRSSWTGVAEALLTRLRVEELGSAELAAVNGRIESLLDGLDVHSHLEIFMRSAALVAQLGETVTVARAREVLDDLDRPEERHLVLQVALGEEGGAAAPQLLVDQEGQLATRWLLDEADRLLGHESVRSHLSLGALLQLGDRIGMAQQVFEELIGELDRRYGDDRRAMTEALVTKGWWYLWRRSTSALGRSAERRLAALDWLSCPAWSGPGVAEATREAWRAALEDLDGQLAAEEMERLCAPEGPRWPWIGGFELDQVQDLGGLGRHLGSLAVLASSLYDEEFLTGAPVVEWLLGESKAEPGWTEALQALLEPPISEVLSLEAAEALVELRECFGPRVIDLLVGSAVCHLDTNGPRVIGLADKARLWQEEKMHGKLRRWLEGKAARVRPETLQAVDERLEDVELAPPGPSSARTRRVAEDLAARDLLNLAGLLDRARAQGVRARRRVGPFLAALESNDVSGLAAQLKRLTSGSQSESPLADLVADLLDTPLDGRCVKMGLERFVSALSPSHVRERDGVLPALELAVVVFRDRGLGEIVLAFARENRWKDRSEPAWWRALLRTMSRCRRRHGWPGANDRPEVARALLVVSMPDLVERAGEALGEALRSSRVPEEEEPETVGASRSLPCPSP